MRPGTAEHTGVSRCFSVTVFVRKQQQQQNVRAQQAQTRISSKVSGLGPEAEAIETAGDEVVCVIQTARFCLTLTKSLSSPR